MRLSAILRRVVRPRRSTAAALLLVPLPLWAVASSGGDGAGPDAATDGSVPAQTAAGAPVSVAASAVDRGVEPASVVDGAAEGPYATVTVDDGATGPAPATVTVDPGLRPLRAAARPSSTFDPQRAPFDVEVDGEPVPYRVMAVLALPGRPVPIEIVGGGGAYALVHAEGVASVDGPGRWRWTPPEEPGIHALRIEGPAGAVAINALVLHPRDEVEGGRMHGYDIGAYREEPLRGSPLYLPPDGFVEMRAEDADVLLSPHLTLGQFRCKQPGEPQYLHVTPALLLKLEALLEAVNDAGYAAPTLHVMSGFRTPAYNRAIGNTTSYSRHLWGDAADVWVDADGDGEMDDWNRDGRVDRADARILLRIAEAVEGKGGVLPGGLGLYRRNAVHGPFVHVDARGYAARW